MFSLFFFLGFVNLGTVLWVYKTGILFVAVLLFILIPQPLRAQYSGYEQAYPSAFLLGVGSYGVAVQDPMGSLYGNPNYLLQSSQTFLSGSLPLTQSSGEYPNPNPSVSGFLPFGKSWGIGGRLKPLWQRNFPEEEKMSNYTGQVFVVYQVTDWLLASLAIGPSVVGRIGGYSSYSWNAKGFLTTLFRNGSFSLGFESPGSFRFSEYQGGSTLEERLPERAFAGVAYQITPWVEVILEGNRALLERSRFRLDGVEERPNPSIRAMGSQNLGLLLGKKDELRFLFGLGREIRASESWETFTTVSIGWSGSVPSWEDSFRYAISLQRFGWQRPDREGAETRLGLQVQFYWTDVPNDQTN